MIRLSGKIKFLLLILCVITAGILLCGYRPIFDYFKKSSGFNTQGITGKPVDLSEIKTGRVIIALALGQSNAGNFGQSLYHTAGNVYSFNKGRLYRYKEPVPGASGPGGSVWGMLGDMLIDKNICDKVVFVCIARGSTSVQCWSEGLCRTILEGTLHDLKRHGLILTHVFWHQGEEDNLYNTAAVIYKIRLGKVIEIIRGYGQYAPVYISVATYNPWAVRKINPALRRAQIDFVSENSLVYPGPDTDTLVSRTDRFDGIHFSETGMRKYSILWFDAVTVKRR